MGWQTYSCWINPSDPQTPSHLLRPHCQPAAEVLPVPGVVELSGVVVVGQYTAMPGQYVHQAGVGSLGVPQDLWMNVPQVGRMNEGQAPAIRGSEEDPTVPAGVNPHAREHGTQGPVQGGGEEILALLQVAEAVDHQRAAGR